MLIDHDGLSHSIGTVGFWDGPIPGLVQIWYLTVVASHSALLMELMAEFGYTTDDGSCVALDWAPASSSTSIKWHARCKPARVLFPWTWVCSGLGLGLFGSFPLCLLSWVRRCFFFLAFTFYLQHVGLCCGEAGGKTVPFHLNSAGSSILVMS